MRTRLGSTSIVIGMLSMLACTSPAPNGGDATSDIADVVDRTVAPDADDTVRVDVTEIVSPEYTDVEITPADQSLDLVPGMTSTIQYTVSATRRDGTRAANLPASWSILPASLGTMSPDGLFTANGSVAGLGIVHAELTGSDGVMYPATAQVTIRIRTVSMGSGVPSDAPTRFTDPPMTDATRAPLIRYPLDNAFMPNNVAAPDIQFSPGGAGAAGDLFRVRIAKSHVTATYYAIAVPGFTYDWHVDANTWRMVLESDPDDPATINVDLLEAASGQTIGATPVHVSFAHGGIFGAVYYWRVTAYPDRTSGLRRINALTAANEDFMPHPPAVQAGAGPCIACHAVSRDGRYLAAVLQDATGGGGARTAIFDLTADLAVDPPPTVSISNMNQGPQFFSFNDDGTRFIGTLAYNHPLGVYDTHTGALIATTGLNDTGTMPEWSPDGTAVAYVTHITPYSVDYPYPGTGDIVLQPMTTRDPLAFGPPATLDSGPARASSPEGGSTDSCPSWSPDSRLVAFQHGLVPLSFFGTTTVSGALYVVNRDGTNAVRLDNANDGPMGTQAFRPTFSPFTTREPDGSRHFWVAFFSRRPYGNGAAGTRGTDRRQIWVAAVNASPAPGHDPSFVPYWLPGQDVATENMAAFWAPVPCRQNGNDCGASSECCSGQCLPDPSMPSRSVCTPPPTSECRRVGQTCGGASDCCNGLTCYRNVCSDVPG